MATTTTERRRILELEGARYVLVSETKQGRVTLQRLDGDFSDYRRILGLKQNDMAELLGVSQASLSRFESGTRTVPDEIRRQCEKMLRGKPRNGQHKPR